MKLQFVYSRNGEEKKLLDIRKEYQWFIDNDFPIALPSFYAEIYKETKRDRDLFIKALHTEFCKMYNENNYQPKAKEVKKNWQTIEENFFNIMSNIGLDAKEKYICHLSLYGPAGQFKLPNIINLRISGNQDIKEANETIAHELVHLMIYSKAGRLDLNYQQTEGVVDLFFTETELKNLFPQYKLQSIAIHDRKMFRRFRNLS